MGKCVHVPGRGKRIIEDMIRDCGKVAKIGYFPSAKYPDGTPVAYVAEIQEYGVESQGILPRSFFRPTIDAKREYWKSILKDGIDKIPSGKMTVELAIERVGLQAEGDVRAKITEIVSPPLAPATMLSRMYKSEAERVEDVSDKPLVEPKYDKQTPGGIMLAHLTSIVEKP